MYKRKYDDIIHLPHYVSKKYPQMSMSNRAAQFAAFQALSGYGNAIKETARLTENKRELDADAIEILDRKLLWIRNNISTKPEVVLTYYRDDELKYGGHYFTAVTKLIKIDNYENCIYTESGMKINIKDIFSIEVN